MSNDRINECYDLARRNGALGGKLIGAGGGGFLMFYTEETSRLRRAMCEAGLREVRYRFPDFQWNYRLLSTDVSQWSRFSARSLGSAPDEDRHLVIMLAMPISREWLGRFMGRPWFSYLTILLLQLKVIWGIWHLRDLTAGDTSSYFLGAYNWYRHMKVEIVWSPLYTAFYGSFLHLSTDAYFATTAHRLIIIFSLTILVCWITAHAATPAARRKPPGSWLPGGPYCLWTSMRCTRFTSSP